MAENQNFTLLVVDDEELNRDLLVRRLAKLNYNVLSASSGHEMFQMLETQPFHLILLDVMMPIMDGFAVLTQFKKNQEWQNIPVIMQTASNNREDVVRCLQLGADDYVTKPYEIHSLKTRIDKFLRKFAAETRNPAEEQATELPSDSDNLIEMLAKSLKAGELKFPMLPAICIKVAEIARQDDVPITELAAVIETDPVLAAKLIKVSNSSHFRGNTATTRVSEAIARIGYKETANQALMAAMSGMFESELPVFETMLEDLWRHSLATATLSRIIAQETGLYDPDQIYTIALLHDIGRLALIKILMDISQKRSIPDETVIHEVLDSLHSEFGVAVLRRWHFSDDFLEVARSHHCEPLTGQPGNAVQIVLFANEFSSQIEAPMEIEVDIPEDLTPYIKPLGLDISRTSELASQAKTEYVNMLSTLKSSNSGAI